MKIPKYMFKPIRGPIEKLLNHLNKSQDNVIPINASNGRH